MLRLNHKTFFCFTLCVFILGHNRSYAVTKILGEGDLLLVTDSKHSRFGALRVLSVNTSERSMVYQWFLLPTGSYDLAGEAVRTGTMEVTQVHGRAVISFGPFVLEWHGGGLKKGIVSANGNLGVQPLLVASSGISSPTRIRDVRSGFLYEMATPREAPDPLGLGDSFAKMPKARLGIGVSQTFADLGLGAEEPALQVTRIDPKSKAYKAGLRKGDFILSFNGIEVLSPEDFQKALSELRPGDAVNLVVYRKEETLDLSFPAEARLSLPQTPPPPVEVDPNLPADEKARLEAGQEVRQRMQQTLEALKALYFD